MRSGSMPPERMTGGPAAYGHDERMFDWPTVYREGLFAGQAALVSGGGSGLGKAAAILFARLGARVIVIGRDRAKLDALEALFRGHGLALDAAVCNIRDPDAVRALLTRVFEQHGRLDHLVNNAGGQFAQDAIDFSVKGWRGGDRHQSERHLVDDAGRRAPLAGPGGGRLDRQYRRGHLARPPRRGAYRGGARRRRLSVERRWRSSGPRSPSG